MTGPRQQQPRACVSIHALAKSATPKRPRPERAHGVSIHALAKSATATPCAPCPMCKRFNPRAREERDASGFRDRQPHGVSIHALAKSATRQARRPRAVRLVSIHALAKSATPTMGGKPMDPEFQSTRSRRARLGTPCARRSGRGRFNPRAREERDHERVDRARLALLVSIHALAKSATIALPSQRIWDTVSIHALAKSATPSYATFWGWSTTFQSTRSRRARPGVSE